MKISEIFHYGTSPAYQRKCYLYLFLQFSNKCSEEADDELSSYANYSTMIYVPCPKLTQPHPSPASAIWLKSTIPPKHVDSILELSLARAREAFYFLWMTLEKSITIRIIIGHFWDNIKVHTFEKTSVCNRPSKDNYL